MAEMTIRLLTDPLTGKKDILVELHSDSDALPHEHERQHRALVEKLIQEGLVKASELGKVVVERVEEAPQGAPTKSASEQPSRESQAESV